MRRTILLASNCVSTAEGWADELSELKADIQIIGPVYSGVELESAAEHSAPDIIISDIHLCDLPSTVIIKRLRSAGSRCRFIAVSEAPTAEDISLLLDASADDFLMSPMPPHKLCEAVSKMIDRIELQPRSIDNEFKLSVGRLFFERARSVSEDKQLPEELVNSMYGTRFQPNAYRLIVLCINRPQEAELSHLAEYLKTVGQALEQKLGAQCFETLYNDDFLRVRLLINYHAENDENVINEVSAVFNDFLPTDDTPIAICCSRLHRSISEIGQMFEEASDIMWTRFITDSCILVYPDSLPECPQEIQKIYVEAEQQMKSACSILDLEMFKMALERFFSQNNSLIGRIETRAMLRSVEYYMFDVNRSLISAFTDARQASRDMVLSLRAATSLNEYKQKYSNHLLRLMQNIIAESAAQLSRPIRIAQQYINEHHAENLTLELVAEHAGLSRVYLSSRFKQENGIGFADYVNKCRINHAKELLENSKMTISNIAGVVGYSGPRYFSRIFKEFEGITPTEYREALHSVE